MPRRARIALLLAGAVVFALAGVAITRAPAPIRVGVLHAHDGTLTRSERPVLEATLFAIDELNRAGGV